ncbi:MAG: hypothetical protein HQ567_07600 [Candidatus Nealsonbacteria bacterium]|nr:hypothetical protein [Candidatus Nealsonbacteria bacterium]
MADSEFTEVVRRLASTARAHNARLRLDLDGEGGAVYGTRDGYLLLAAALIEAVAAPQTNSVGQSIARVETESLVAQDSDFFDFTLYVTDEFPPRPDRSDSPFTQDGCAIGWVIFSSIAIVVSLAAVGAVAIIRWFW